LDAAGLTENTLVIVTTDHGIPFPRMKADLYDGGIGVMLIMRGPGGFTGGQVCDALISQLDIFPTVCELLGIDPPAWLEGKSFLPVVRGEATEVNEQVFSELTFVVAYEPMRAVRTKRWKYLRRYSDSEKPIHARWPNDSISQRFLVEQSWGQRPAPREELYDLLFDPNERENKAADPACAGILSDMRGRLDRWMRATDDPLLRGPVPAPPGAQVWSPDAVSVTEPMLPPAS
jgi:arylsulfatase A-like enzyme